MEEENKEEVKGNPLTKEEMIDAIKSAFKDNEEGLKIVNNIMDNLVELKKLDKEGQGSPSFRMWIMFLMFLFGIPSFEQPSFGLEPEERKEDETDKTQL